MIVKWRSKEWVKEAAKNEGDSEIGAGYLAYYKPLIIKGELMDKESSDNRDAPKEETTLVTNVDIEPVINGWVVTVEYDEDIYRKFSFTNLETMLGFIRDMTGTPIRVRDLNE